MKHLTSATLTAALLGFTTSAFATQTENHGIHAVPAPDRVSIDGDLAEWDKSGAITISYDLESLRDIYSAQTMAMYDADNFYVAIHWKDPRPMGNSHDPRYQASRGWAGDAVQLRFKTDRISHLTAWYYAAKKEPAIQIAYGKSLTEPFKGGELQLYQTEGAKLQQGAEMGFKADADGKGYVQEIKIPWKLITLDGASKVGAEFSMGMEFLWGEADWPDHRYADNLAVGTSSREFFWTAKDGWGPVFLEPKGNLKLPEPAYMVAYRRAIEGDVQQGPVEIAYDLPKDARVSLAIEDKDGVRIRNLVPALERKKGRNVEKWDGLDDEGKPVAPGDYRFKAIYHDGIKANYALSFASPGNPSWATSDNRGAFYGDHTPPQAATAAGDFVALAAPMGEAGRHLIGLDLSGQRLWGLPNRAAFDGGQISLATDGKTLWVASEGQESTIYRVDAKTGKYAPWNRQDKDAQGNEFNVLDLKVSDLPGVKAAPDAGANMTGIALNGNTLAVAFQRENKIKLLDAQTGEVRQEIAVTAPQSVAYAGDTLLVLARGRIWQANRNGAPFTKQEFRDAYGMATDDSGHVYLSVRGADQNVKVFSPDGKLVREIGKRGGRPQIGAFDANAMRQPAGLAVDSKGRLWVTEETMNPKRTSVWNTRTGTLEKDLSGTTTYAGAGSINAFDPTMGFSDGTVYRLNWETGASEPIYSLALSAVNGNSGNHSTLPDEMLFPPAVHNLTNRVVKQGDKTYVFTTSSARGSREIHATVFDGKTWRSAMHIGTVNTRDNKSEFAKYQKPIFADHDEESYLWLDNNADGLVQASEMQFFKPQMDGKPTELRSFYWGQLPDTQGTLIYMLKDQNALWKLPMNASGKGPLYDLNKAQIVKLEQPIAGNGEGQLIGGSEGRVYLNQSPITAVDRDGKTLGIYPSNVTSVHGSHKATASKPGYVIGPSSFLGTAEIPNVGEVFYLNGNLGENSLFTQDGLYIQTLFKDGRGYFDNPNRAVRGMPMDATTAGGESFGGNFVRASNGKTYLTLGGTDAKVMEISGLESIRRLDGKFAYTPAQYAETQQLAIENAARAQQPKIYTVARAATPADINGKADEWPELLNDDSQLLEIREADGKAYARVQARWDAANLYLGYRVFAPRGEMKNAGQDDRLLFKTGDAVDLMIGAENGQGVPNTRILLSFPDRQPVAILNQKTAPGAAASEKFAFASPWRSFTFDRVATLRDAKLASSPIQGGYFVEAAIPWKDLGIAPQSGLQLKADVGALFADAGGTTTVSRQYWSNRQTGLVNDVPGEADLTPQLWGTFVLE